ncbi:MAG: hypothetical protein QOF94_1445 [Acidobacteriaceae bacterium]|jgi:hypothetical protein
MHDEGRRQVTAQMFTLAGTFFWERSSSGRQHSLTKWRRSLNCSIA